MSTVESLEALLGRIAENRRPAPPPLAEWLTSRHAGTGSGADAAEAAQAAADAEAAQAAAEAAKATEAAQAAADAEAAQAAADAEAAQAAADAEAAQAAAEAAKAAADAEAAKAAAEADAARVARRSILPLEALASGPIVKVSRPLEVAPETFGRLMERTLALRPR